MNIFGCVITLICFYINHSFAYFITVDAHAEECFFDKVEAGTKMGNELVYFQYCKISNLTNF